MRRSRPLRRAAASAFALRRSTGSANRHDGARPRSETVGHVRPLEDSANVPLGFSGRC